ncbi:MAG: ribonuclease E/G [Alphaproteobacteria bacterium]
MSRAVHVAEADGVLYAAVIEDGRPTDLLAEPIGRLDHPGDVVLGTVARVDRAAGAAFVDLGIGRPAFVPLRRSMAAGGAVAVQIVNAARDDKGAEATTDIALAGRYLVHLPHRATVTLSRALDAGARLRWRRVLHGGWIVRRSAESVPDDAVIAEAGQLTARWRAIDSAAAAARPPACLQRGPDAGQRLILDTQGVGEIRVEPPARARSLGDWLRRTAPDLSHRLAPGATAIAEALPALLTPMVPLPGGGSIVIEPTRAVTAIDVDAGAADPFRANQAAACEIARQLRLRNIGGLVVIDFISMKRREDRAALVDTLKRALDGDPASVRLGGGVSRLGLVELARQRRGLSLAEAVAG